MCGYLFNKVGQEQTDGKPNSEQDNDEIRAAQSDIIESDDLMSPEQNEVIEPEPSTIATFSDEADTDLECNIAEPAETTKSDIIFGSEAVDEENALTCPYCGGTEMIQIGLGLFVCGTCKGKVVDCRETHADVLLSAVPENSKEPSSEAITTSKDGRSSYDSFLDHPEAILDVSTKKEGYESFLNNTNIPADDRTSQPDDKKPKKQYGYIAMKRRRKKVAIISGIITAVLAVTVAVVVSVVVPPIVEANTQKGIDNEILNWTDAQKKSHGVTPKIDTASGTITYGLYPQIALSDNSIIKKLDRNKLYRKNNFYYFKGNFYTKIESSRAIWFKCEPIEWKILSSGNGTYSVVSSTILDAHTYDSTYNSYGNSAIRNWLNSTFYYTAFALGNDCIRTTEVDNSESTTGSPSNSYACANTNDNIYLLSYKDYANTAYFADSSARCCKTTDWAKAKRVANYNSYGYYWTRSPHSGFSDYVWCVDYDGALDYHNGVNLSRYGVRPALTLSVS